MYAYKFPQSAGGDVRGPDLSTVYLPGYEFLLKRCKQATSILVWLEGIQAPADFMMAFRLVGPKSVFGHVKFLSLSSDADAVYGPLALFVFATLNQTSQVDP